MSSVFCVLIFAMLFAIVLVNTTSTGAKHATANNLVSKLGTEIPVCTLYLASTVSYDRCDVSCWTTANLTKDVELAIADDVDCRSIGYHLLWYEPQVSKLSPGWFKTSAFIKKMSIRDVLEDPKIAEIEPGAFDDCTFRKMTELLIRRTKVTQLKRGVFEGANSLKKLTLEQNGYLKEIEAYTLNPLLQLEELVMTQQKQFENVLNVTGTTQLTQSRTLTLSLMNFTSSINAETFTGCTSVETISLFSSMIQTIGIGSFDPMAKTIQYIDLSNNQLKHLPSDLLTNLMRPTEAMYLALSNNLWHCDCVLLELQLWINNNSNIIADWPLVCDTPASEYGKLIANADLSICEIDSKSPITPETDELTTPQSSTDCVDTSSIWGHDEIIIVLVCSTVLSLGVGLACGWLLRCRYQRVFKAKNALLYQSSAMSTSKTETSNITTTDYVGAPNARILRRTYSDNSIVSFKSYITAITPSPFEIIQWKLRKNAMNFNAFQTRDYLDKSEGDCFPPALPPLPNRRHSEKIYETIGEPIGEPIYTCTSEITPCRITYANQR